MKLNLDTAAQFFTIAAAAGIVACASNPPKPEASSELAQPKQEDAKPVEAAQQTADQFKAQGQAELDKALEALKGVSVFFEFDSATLTKDAQDKLGNVANILTQHPDLKVRIEGNADERGSEQYNLALGQRRAEAAKKYLANLGVKGQQISAISFGAEKPKAKGHDEDAWKQNRRDDVAAQK